MKQTTHNTGRGKTGRKTQPIRNKEQVQESKDEHIDQDFPGYPHNPSRENIIDPKTPEEHSTANPGKKDSTEKKRNRLMGKNKKEKPYANGSGGAFEATEESSSPAGESDEDNDDLALGRNDEG